MARRDRRRDKFGPPREPTDPPGTSLVPATTRALSLVPPVSGQADSRVPVGIGMAPPTIQRWIPTTFGELGWPQVFAIEQLAQRGMTMQFVDLSRRMLETDGHILSCYSTRIDPVAGAQFSVKPPTGVSEQRRAMSELAASDCLAALQGINPESLFRHLLDGIFTGWAVAEIVWAVRDGMVWPVDIILHDPRRFQFADDFSLYVYDQGYASGDAKYNSAVNALGPPLERDKFIIHCPKVLPTYPNKAGLFHALVRNWWCKSWLLKYWMNGAENAGNPRLVATVTQNADHWALQYLAKAMNDLSADAQCVVREGIDMKFLESAKNVGEVWDAACAYWDANTTKAVLGSTLNVEIGQAGGNRAAAESQDAATILPRLEGDQRQMWKTIERCLFEPFLRFNMARYGGVMPDVPVGSSEIVRQKAEVDTLIVDQGGVTYDELRTSRGLEPWGAAAGGDVRIPRKVDAAPAFGMSQQTSAASGASRSGAPSPLGGAGAADPLPLTAMMPWQRAQQAALRSSQRKRT